MNRQISVRRSLIERLLIIATVVVILAAVAGLPLVGSPIVDPSGRKEIYVSAHMWEFYPSTIVVNKGERVVLKLTSLDTRHGFYLSMLNITEVLEPEKTVQVEFVADKVGVFEFSCTVFCGLRHAEMVGQIVVRE